MSRYGNQLLCLMDLPPESRVLIVGESIASWSKYFQNANFFEIIPALVNASDVYDLILYHSAVAESRNKLNADLNHLRNILSPSGSVLFFAENLFSFNQLKNLMLGRFDVTWKKLWCFNSSYRKLLQRSGFKSIRSFIPLPVLEHPEELVAVGSKLLELPHYSHPVIKAFHRFGCYHTIAEGFVFLGGSCGSSKLLSKICDVISKRLQFTDSILVLERLDIRLRGAFVLFLTERNSAKGYIVRLVADRKVDSIVSKNHDFLEYLQSGTGFSDDIKNTLPQTICRIEHFGSIVYVETMVAGMPAWKVNRGKLRDQIFRDAVDFLLQVYLASRQTAVLSAVKLEIILTDDFSSFVNCSVIDAGFRNKVLALLNLMKNRLNGLEIDLVASHGDYGYGNILVDPSSGALKGVIDWDTGRRQDLPGVDFINLLVQKERAERNCGVLDAFFAVVNEGLSEANLGILNEFGITGQLLGVIVNLAFTRYMSRSAQYPQVFLREQSDYMGILDLLQLKLPL